MLSCGCLRFERSTSQRVAMPPARFLQSWEVHEMDIHDMGASSEAGNKHLLAIVDRVSKFLFAYPLPDKTAEIFGQETPRITVYVRDTPVPVQQPRHGVHRRGCPARLQMAQRDGRLWPYRSPKGSRNCREVGGWVHETLVELCKS